MRTGVYFLANDTYFDQAIAFLNSFRKTNGSLELCLIPFDDNATRIKALSGLYEFTVLDEADLLRACDEIGLQFHGVDMGHYRKLVAWSGPFDRFIYIDSDTVVLRDVSFVFDLLDHHEFITTHSNIPGIRRFVWNDSVEQSGLLPAQFNYATNTGFIASRRGALDVRQIARDLNAALEMAPHMALDFFEQPFLNYQIVTSGLRYTSLYQISLATGDAELPMERWAGTDIGQTRDGTLIPLAGDPPPLLVHWAGEWDRARREGTSIRYYEFWRHYRELAPRVPAAQ
jgi:hypothetical protein